MKKINLLLFSAALVGLTSCLKDGKVNLAPGASPAVVEWSTAVVDLAPSSSVSGSPYTLYSASYDAVASVNQNLQIGYTGGGTAPSAITANIAASSAALLAYNQANFGTASTASYFTELPSTLYTLPATATIAAGSNKANLAIAIKTAQFDFTKKYAIALSITSAPGATVSGNYGTIILAVSAKNKYDGKYKLTAGTFNDNLNATFTYQGDIVLEFRTQTATSVAPYDGVYAQNNYCHPFLVNNGDGTFSQSSYGSYAPVWNMDATDKVIGVTNYFGQPASNGRSARLDASGVNQWTISGNSKVMKVSYWLQGPGFVDRTLFVETWTYQGPR